VRICNIAPIQYLSELISSQETHHLVVADKLLESEEYLQFYRQRLQRGDFVIMDSMAFENPYGTPVSVMVDAARRLQPSEIVLPDDMESGERTVQMARRAMAEFRFLGIHRPRFQAVPHGKTLDQYLKVAYSLARIPHVTTIGIQEEVEEDFGVARVEVVKRVKAVTNKQIHLLGVTESLNEWRDEELRWLVRTCDTSKLVVYGFGGVRIDPHLVEVPVYPGRTHFGGREGYFNYKFGESFVDDVGWDPILLAKYNIDTWRDFVSAEGGAIDDV
jgi:hypothetical protein